jgi:hypothetical protein
MKFPARTRYLLAPGRPLVRPAAALALFLLASAGLAPASARADVLGEWNDAAVGAIVEAKLLPPAGSRVMAILDVAMFDAVNAVQPRYEPYAWRGGAVRDASAEAAAASAAHAVLEALLPDRGKAWDGLLAASLARIPAGPPRDGGIALGQKVAAVILALRADDGSNAPNTYRPITTPGRYVPTALPVSTAWGRVKPWTLERCDQFRPAPPPPIESAVWQRDVEEIRTVGGRASTSRTAYQSEAARFWVMAGPPALWPVMRSLASAPGRTLVQDARLFAAATMAVADAHIAVFDAKYAYLFWRPITAVRNGGGLHEPGPQELAWEPLLDTPMHPEYPCAHCITSAALAAVMEEEFGTGTVPTIDMTSLTAPGVTHHWTTIDQYVQEVSSARIWGGIHYRNSTEVGASMGRQIAAKALARLPPRADMAQERSPRDEAAR